MRYHTRLCALAAIVAATAVSQESTATRWNNDGYYVGVVTPAIAGRASSGADASCFSNQTYTRIQNTCAGQKGFDVPMVVPTTANQNYLVAVTGHTIAPGNASGCWVAIVDKTGWVKAFAGGFEFHSDWTPIIAFSSVQIAPATGETGLAHCWLGQNPAGTDNEVVQSIRVNAIT